MTEIERLDKAFHWLFPAQVKGLAGAVVDAAVVKPAKAVGDKVAYELGAPKRAVDAAAAEAAAAPGRAADRLKAEADAARAAADAAAEDARLAALARADGARASVQDVVDSVATLPDATRRAAKASVTVLRGFSALAAESGKEEVVEADFTAAASEPKAAALAVDEGVRVESEVVLDDGDVFDPGLEDDPGAIFLAVARAGLAAAAKVTWGRRRPFRFVPELPMNSPLPHPSRVVPRRPTHPWLAVYFSATKRDDAGASARGRPRAAEPPRRHASSQGRQGQGADGIRRRGHQGRRARGRGGEGRGEAVQGSGGEGPRRRAPAPGVQVRDGRGQGRARGAARGARPPGPRPRGRRRAADRARRPQARARAGSVFLAAR